MNPEYKAFTRHLVVLAGMASLPAMAQEMAGLSSTELAVSRAEPSHIQGVTINAERERSGV